MLLPGVYLPYWQYLGNVDLALSEIRARQKQDDRGEAMIRTTVRKVSTQVSSQGPSCCDTIFSG